MFFLSGDVVLSWEHASAVLSAEMLLRETKSYTRLLGLIETVAVAVYFDRLFVCTFL